jgi:hypothetical protein
MLSEVDEAVVIKTNKPIGFRVADIDPWSGKEYNVKTDKAYDNAQAKKKLPQGADFAAQRRKERLASNGRMDEEQHSVLYKMKKDDEKIAVAHYKSKDDAHKFLSSVKTKGGNGIVRTKTNEEVEQVDENEDLSNARKMYHKHFVKAMKAMPSSAIQKHHQDEMEKYKKIMGNSFLDQVVPSKFAKFDKKTNEEVEELDELSSDLLGRYKTGASKQASELDKAGNIKKADSRFRGIVKATKKQFNNDLKKESVMEMDKSQTPPGRDGPLRPGPDKEAKPTTPEKFKNHALSILQKSLQAKDKKKDVKEASSPAQQAAIAIAMKKDGKKPMNETLEEGRPSERHPLEGHDYHKKTDAELVYIAKDAHKAADAMKSHNTDAENKYRDQANDSATVRYFRQKNGMPDWYKKKYGHVKESVEVLDGEEVQASEAIDNIQESRKKAIVREALKDAKDRMEKKGKKEEKKDAVGGKGDKFEADPQMTSLVNDKQ